MKKPVPSAQAVAPNTNFTPPSAGGDYIFDPVSGKAVPVQPVVPKAAPVVPVASAPEPQQEEASE